MNELRNLRGQTGAALITSLIFLTVLTILGMSTLGTALLESRMAGNARDRNLAFQAAEIGLRDAEGYIRNAGRIWRAVEVGHDNVAGCTGAAGSNCDAQECKFGFCYNGGDMAANATSWVATSVWGASETYWANALQYAQDDQSVPGMGADARKTARFSNPVKLVLNEDTGSCGEIMGDCNYSQPDLLPLVRRQPEYLIEAFQKDVAGDTRFYYRVTVRAYGVRSGTRVMLQEVYTP